MKLHRIQLATATALGVIALVGFSGQAHAGAFAFATTQVTGFQIKANNSAGAELTGADFSALNVNTSQTAQATLDGTTVNGVANPASGVIQQACIGNHCPLVSPFSFFGPPPPINGSFAQAATQLSGTIVNVGAGAGGANANVAAQTQLTGTHVTSVSPGDLNVSAGFAFVLAGAPGTSRTIDINFAATTQLVAGLDTKGKNAQANSKYEIKITCAQSAGCGTFANNAVVFDWKPDGTTSITGGTVNSAGVNLNNSVSENFLNQVNDTGVQSGTFDATVGLVEGVQYNFSIDHNDSVDATSVPEPATLAMFAAGLLGLGFTARRRWS